MVPCSLYEIASLLGIKYTGIDIVIKSISIDSRSVPKQCMFIALIGKNFDGHDFAEQAVIGGAQALLVNRSLLLKIPQLIVTNTHDALMKIAKLVRNRVSSRVIAITGSSGKTSVKDMTTSILKNLGTVVSTYKNCNNLIGVPITLLRLTDQNNFAVIELGANRIGELRQLSDIVAADVALVNNIYPSHLLGFKSLTMIKKEKGEIFKGLVNHGQAVINADNHACSIWDAALKGKNVWRFSLFKKSNVEFFSSNIVLYSYGTRFVLHTPQGQESVFFPMLGYHNVSNALAASALAFSVGANLSEIITGLQDIQPLPGRLFPVILNKGKLLLIDDSYNSNVGSMIATISILNTMPGYRILVISDMLELGSFHEISYHCYIGRYIIKTNIHQVLTLGQLSYFISKFCKRGKHFQSKSKLICYLSKILFQNRYTSVVIKGSRIFHMEEIVYAVKDKLK